MYLRPNINYINCGDLNDNNPQKMYSCFNIDDKVNRMTEKIKHAWLNPGLEVRNSNIGGKGVFSKENIINKSTRLAIFGGKLMFIDELRNLPKTLQKYPIQIEERFILGPPQNSIEPDETDFFNHSCEPNSGFKGQIFLVAMRDIKKNEEITFDYAMVVSESVGSDFVFEMECKCGCSNCRKKITVNDWKDPDIQKKYNGFFSQYLQDKCSFGNNSEMSLPTLKGGVSYSGLKP
jgi:hypothetical protein